MMIYKTVQSVEESKKIILDNKGILIYFSTLKCSLSEALEPKIFDLIQSNFPKMVFYFVDINKFPELAAHFSVFVEPSLLVFFEGKESIRKSRAIGIEELSSSIARLYKLIFEE